MGTEKPGGLPRLENGGQKGRAAAKQSRREKARLAFCGLFAPRAKLPLRRRGAGRFFVF